MCNNLSIVHGYIWSHCSHTSPSCDTFQDVLRRYLWQIWLQDDDIVDYHSVGMWMDVDWSRIICCAVICPGVANPHFSISRDGWQGNGVFHNLPFVAEYSGCKYCQGGISCSGVVCMVVRRCQPICNSEPNNGTMIGECDVWVIWSQKFLHCLYCPFCLAITLRK